MKDKIFFVYPNESSFVNKDVELLSHHYEVVRYEFKVAHKLFTPLALVKQLFFLLFSIFKFRLVVCQLSAYHSLLPALFAKITSRPCIIFLGGTDCAHFPSIRYGNFFRPLLGGFTALSAKLASHLAPKHHTLIDFPYTYDDHDFPRQGIACFVNKLKTPYTVVHNGYNAEVFKPTGDKIPKTFLTVAADIGLSNIVELKGIDLILKVAPFFPDCTFTLAGVADGVKLPGLPSNVFCLPAQTQQQLVALYATQQFYFQLSMSEGFPNAVCEAMLCGCIPIVSDVNALPDIGGSSGFVLCKRNADDLILLIKKALNSNSDLLGAKAREHIATHFSLKQRENKLLQLINEEITR